MPFFNTDYCSKDGLSHWCSHCLKKHRKVLKSPEAPETWSRKKDYRDRVNRIKSDSGCSRCPENFAGCLEFHHLEPDEKIDTIPNLIKFGYDWEVIETEISKCEILCANCHRKLHVFEREETEDTRKETESY